MCTCIHVTSTDPCTYVCISWCIICIHCTCLDYCIKHKSIMWIQWNPIGIVYSIPVHLAHCCVHIRETPRAKYCYCTASFTSQNFLDLFRGIRLLLSNCYALTIPCWTAWVSCVYKFPFTVYNEHDLSSSLFLAGPDLGEGRLGSCPGATTKRRPTNFDKLFEYICRPLGMIFFVEWGCCWQQQQQQTTTKKKKKKIQITPCFSTLKAIV